MKDNLIFLKEGKYLLRENDKGYCFYILKSGILEVLKKNLLLSEISNEGTVFGEMSYFNNGLRTSSIRAKTKATVLRIDASLDRVIEKYPEVTKKIISQLTSRVNEMDEKNVKLRENIEISNKKVLKQKEMLSDYAVSLMHYLEGLEKRNTEKVHQAYTSSYLFFLLMKCGNNELAEEYFEKALTIAKEEKLSELESRLNLDYARMFMKENLLLQAEKYLNNSFAVYNLSTKSITDDEFLKNEKLSFAHRLLFIDALIRKKQTNKAERLLRLLSKDDIGEYQKAVIYYLTYSISGDLKERFLAMDFLRKLYKKTDFEYYRKKISMLKKQ